MPQSPSEAIRKPLCPDDFLESFEEDCRKFVNDLANQSSDSSSDCSSQTSGPPSRLSFDPPSLPKAKFQVQFAEETTVSSTGSARASFLRPGTAGRIVVDEVDDLIGPLPDAPVRPTMHGHNRSIMRINMSSRAVSRNGSHLPYRRDLSRGNPISRDSIMYLEDGRPLTEDEIARQLRPELFTRFKKIRQPDVVRGRRITSEDVSLAANTEQNKAQKQGPEVVEMEKEVMIGAIAEIGERVEVKVTNNLIDMEKTTMTKTESKTEIVDKMNAKKVIV